MIRYRVLTVSNLWPTDADPGFGSFVKAQMESLRAFGVDYEVLFVNGRESIWNYLRGIWCLHQRLWTGRYDLIHAHFGLSGWIARFQWVLPVVVSFMGDDVLGRPRRDGSITAIGRFFQISSFVLARVVSAVIVKSAQMKARLGLRSAYVIPNGVDLDLFRPMDRAETRRALGLDAQKKFVLYPYNVSDNISEPRKRYDLIEAAVARARKDLPEIEILHVRGVPREQMPLYFNAADVMVLASMLEGSPNALKEAMAVNLPLVTVDVGDARDLIKDTPGCYLVERDPESIAAKIVEICRSGLRSSGRACVERLAMDRIAERIIEVYARATSRVAGTDG